MRLESKTLTLTLLSAAAFQFGLAGIAIGPDADACGRRAGSCFTAHSGCNSAGGDCRPRTGHDGQCKCTDNGKEDLHRTGGNQGSFAVAEFS